MRFVPLLSSGEYLKMPALSNQLLAELFPAGRSVEESLYQVFISRGFLLEVDDRELRLSDNAAMLPDRVDYYHDKRHLSDPDFLTGLLRKTDFGYLRGNLQISCHDYDPAKLPLVFSQEPISGEAGYMVYMQGWSHFRKLHPPKKGAAALEPFIALLVKAFGSAGAASYSSCDGHGERYAHIAFISGYHAIWAEAITQWIGRSLKFQNSWQFSGPTLIIDKGEQSNYGVDFFREILTAGHFLYQNRLALQDFKRQLVEICQKEHDLKSFSQQVEKIMQVSLEDFTE